MRSGESASTMAEELAFEERLGKRTAVLRNEATLLAGAGVVDRTGDEILAGSRLARDEQRGIGGGDFLDHVEDPQHGRALADQLIEGVTALDLAPHGIQANAIAPGYFATELTRALVADPVFSEWVVGRTPARRWGDTRDLIGATVFLASSASDFVNGQTIYVDGGMTAVV